MRLGSPFYSADRWLKPELVVFAQWENQDALTNFLAQHNLGKTLTKGWYLRLKLVRQWGSVPYFDLQNTAEQPLDDEQLVAAVTLAHMRFRHIPRFIRWGKPVEELVRDHPATTLALASFGFPNCISTFSIWKSAREMSAMVHGHSQVAKPKRHQHAMKERERKDFHYSFTTLRFLALSEHGHWDGRSDYTLARN